MKLTTTLCIVLSFLFSCAYAAEKDVNFGDDRENSLMFPLRNQKTSLETSPQLEQRERTSMQLGLYEHYRGNKYRVIGLCRHSETLEELVVYQALYGDYGLWVRPLAMFQETITHDGKEMPRFKFLHTLFEESPQLR